MKKTTAKTTAAKLDVKLVHSGRNQNAWTEGTATVGGKTFSFQVKHFDEGSAWGYKQGRVSKVWIGDENGDAANYDRGWDVRPKTAEAKAVFNAIVKTFN